MIQARWIPGNEDLSECMALRREVFVKEQSVLVQERDWIDEYALHVLVYNDKKPVATGRIYGVDVGIVKVDCICVSKYYRSRKLGDLVLRMLLFQAQDLNAKFVEVTTAVSAQGFYETLGFLPEGEKYLKEGVPLVDMKLAVKDIKLSCEDCKEK